MALEIAAERPVHRTGVRPRHVPVGPLAVFDGGMDDAVGFCVEAVRSGSGARVATANLDFIALARSDALLREDLAHADLVVADGTPVVWLARMAGARRVGRVNGTNLATGLLERAASLGGLRVAMYGSEPDISRDAATWIEQTFPKASVVARLTPPFRQLTADERAVERVLLSEVAPHVVFVALGCPRQEHLIAEYYEAAPSAVWIGVGGSFDFFAGRRVRAPRLLQAVGLEWAVRLMQEPGRLWRRYLLRDIPALAAVLPGCLAARFSASPADPAMTSTQPGINGEPST